MTKQPVGKTDTWHECLDRCPHLKAGLYARSWVLEKGSVEQVTYRLDRTLAGSGEAMA